MSWYYSYYLGYINKEGQIIPLGPFDNKKRIIPILTRSRSYASDLHESFYSIEDNLLLVSADLKKYFQTKDLEGNATLELCSYLPYKELPAGSFIKDGYFLISDVEAYKKNGSAYDLFYDSYSAEAYAAKVLNELRLGPPKEVKDCEGYDITPKTASNYMFYAYPDYSCAEYESHIIRTVADSFFDYKDVNEGNLVIILEEG